VPNELGELLDYQLTERNFEKVIDVFEKLVHVG
jgi:hypothetical protein